MLVLAADMMQHGADPGALPLCGQTITIKCAGKQHSEVVVDARSEVTY